MVIFVQVPSLRERLSELTYKCKRLTNIWINILIHENILNIIYWNIHAVTANN